MTRNALAVLALSLGALGTPGAHAAEPTWYLLLRETGCVPLTELHEAHPFLADRSTPREIFDALRRRYPDTVLQTVQEALAVEARRDGSPLPPQAKAFYRPFNKTNSAMVSSQQADLEAMLLTEALCKSIGGFKGQ